ncbi:MAG: GNAT family N-acetyltransferase [Candidatus Aenigmarchaeota archaeon]|nr:GNAT family N-acetyltransferase [Candidatus Aenigmarchaeota archaeon]
MQDITFRQAEEKDFDRIHEIALKGWLFAYNYLPKEALKNLVSDYYSKENLKSSLRKVKHGTDLFIVAADKNKVAGFCHVGVKNSEGEIYRLYIDLSFIGKGIGKRLLLKGELFLREKGCKKCLTFVNKFNKLGADFYIRNGYVHIPELDKEDEFKNGKVLWCVEKRL